MAQADYSQDVNEGSKSDTNLPDEWERISSPIHDDVAYVTKTGPTSHYSKLSIENREDDSWIVVYEPLSGETKDQPNQYNLPNNLFNSRKEAEGYAETLIKIGIGEILSEYGIQKPRSRSNGKQEQNWASEFSIQALDSLENQ